MVRNYKRTTEDIWSREDLLNAMIDIKEGIRKINDAAKYYHISRATLYRQFKKFLQAGGKYDVNQFRHCGGNPILTSVEESVLKKTILDLREQGFNVTPVDIRRICYEYCDSNQIPTKFNREKRIASDDWYYGFLRRHPGVKIADETVPVQTVRKYQKKKKDHQQQELDKIVDLLGVESEPKSPTCGNNSSEVSEIGVGSDEKKETVINKSSPKRKASSPTKQCAHEKKARLDLVEEIFRQLEDDKDDEKMENKDSDLQEADQSSSKAEQEDENEEQQIDQEGDHLLEEKGNEQELDENEGCETGSEKRQDV